MDAVKPEGAEMRFSEHVCNEIRAGRFKKSRFWGIFDDYGLVSPDADRYRYAVAGDILEYNRKVFSLSARSTWFGFGKPRAALDRGTKDLTSLLSDAEHQALYDAYQEGLKIWKDRQTVKQREEEAKRQRAAWWP